jgi:hypothetical protein
MERKLVHRWDSRVEVGIDGVADRDGIMKDWII